MSDVPGDLVAVKRAAAILRCAPSTVYRYIASGKLRSWLRCGVRHLVSEEEVRGLLQPVEPMVPLEKRGEAERRQDAALGELRQKGYAV
jgi:excisionase family DNA binding protein